MKQRRVGIGIVGMGFMGLTHLNASQTLKGGAVVAFVTADPRKARGDFRSVRGNFGNGGGRVNVKAYNVYPSLDQLLADDSVDLVDICLPSHLHASAATRALRGGKHVLVEKPMALTLADTQRMMRSAQSSGNLLMVAQVLKFFPEFSALEKGIRTKQWGELLALHMRRIIAKPNWGGSWFADSSKSGGMVVDLHIHDTDYLVYLFGKPRSVTSHGIVRNRQVDYLRTTYHYKKSHGPLLTSEAGWINGASLAFEHGFDAFFENASLHFNSTHTPRPLLYQGKKARELKLGSKDGVAVQMEQAVKTVRSAEVPPGLSPSNAAIALEVCRAEEKAVRSKRTGEL